MKLPNGFGSVYKLSGKRRNPWVAAKTFGWKFDEKTGKAKQIQKPIVYFPTRQEAMTALVNFNENPYDINAEQMTFNDVYEKWSDAYFPTLGSKSSIRTITAAYKYCEPLYHMRMRDIRVSHLEHKPHDTRHTFITKAKNANMNEYILKLMVGHAINDITEETYTHRTIEELHKEIRKIEK